MFRYDIMEINSEEHYILMSSEKNKKCNFEFTLLIVYHKA